MLTDAAKQLMKPDEDAEWSIRGQSCLQWLIFPVQEAEFLNVSIFVFWYIQPLVHANSTLIAEHDVCTISTEKFEEVSPSLSDPQGERKIVSTKQRGALA